MVGDTPHALWGLHVCAVQWSFTTSMIKEASKIIVKMLPSKHAVISQLCAEYSQPIEWRTCGIPEELQTIKTKSSL